MLSVEEDLLCMVGQKYQSRSPGVSALEPSIPGGFEGDEQPAAAKRRAESAQGSACLTC